MVQNLIWSGVYLRITLSSDLLQEILKLATLKVTIPEVYVATMTTVLFDYYDSLVDTLEHNKSLKIKDHPGGNVTDCYDTILVDVELLESSGAFKPKHPGYTIRIFEDTSNSRIYIWATNKYKEVMDFVKIFLYVTKTSCKLMISLPMVSLFKDFCKNTATLLTQSGGNPLIGGRCLNMNIYF